MSTLAKFFLCLNIINEVKTIDIHEAFEETAINNKVVIGRSLKQQTNEEQIRFQSDGCDPAITDCSLASQVCEDKLFPLTTDCSDVVERNNCNNPQIKGIYCNKSCGYCAGTPSAYSIFTPTSTPTAIPTPSPTPQTAVDCENMENVVCDVDALIAFKNSMTEGASLLSSWQGRDPCNTWEFVACDLKGQRVARLKLDFQNDERGFTLTGSIVPEISKLRFLRSFEVTFQNVRGSLHQEFSVLDALESVVLFETFLTGTIPNTFFSTWTKINVFSTPYNSLSGSLPEQFSTWNNIVNFDVSNNQFEGFLPNSYSTWSQCKSFNASKNNIAGTLPSQYSLIQQIQEFQVLKNKMLGSLPIQLSTWKQCTKFRVGFNNMSGTLPVEYSKMTNMQFLGVGWSNFSGTLPSQYSEMNNMDVFDVEDNLQVFGSLPVQYSTFSVISQFDLRNTAVSSQIPLEWSSFPDSTEILF